jgi:glycosyltransferase involved in cell wall biosynthesis
MAQRLLRPLVRPDTVKMWASSPYGFAAAWHAIPGPVQAELLQRCDAVIALTEHERAFMAPVTDKAHAIGAGVDSAAFRDADGRRVRARYGIGDAPLVGYIGRMDAAKGIDVLVRAMQSVWRVVPEARLLLAGGVAEQSRESGRFLSVALDALSPDERSRIVMTGRFSDQDKASLFDALDVFAMPSLAESFGIVYLEAWMCRKPVIAARLGATEFVIDDGVDGDLVSPGDAGELAAAIVRLLGDRDRRQRFGAAGYAKTLARFTWDRVTDAVEHLYGHVCEGADPRPVAATDESVVTVKSHEPI